MNKKRWLSLSLAVLLTLTGCGARAAEERTPKRYEASFLTLFDTVTTVVGYAESEEDFRAVTQRFHDELLEYHQLFDIYNDYEGIVNLKALNDSAGGGAVAVDGRIVDLLLFCRELYESTGGRVDVTMGSVLSLWHEAREEGVEDPEQAALPDIQALRAAAEHTGFDRVVIDEAAATVEITDPNLRLDVGAVAKGYAVERVCEGLPSGLLVSVGGNVRATGPKPQGDAPWVVGVQDPDGGREDYLHTVYVTDGSVVTSGDYQRYYTVDGVRYHHIIDPDTLFPAGYWRAVTILCDDSGLADALSTALYTLPREAGQALLDRCGAEALWVDGDGNEFYSLGFSELLRT